MNEAEMSNVRQVLAPIQSDYKRAQTQLKKENAELENKNFRTHVAILLNLLLTTNFSSPYFRQNCFLSQTYKILNNIDFHRNR
jgi:hypothetical protein